MNSNYVVGGSGGEGLHSGGLEVHALFPHLRNIVEDSWASCLEVTTRVPRQLPYSIPTLRSQRGVECRVGAGLVESGCGL